jgi:magnesium transporter
MDDFRKKFGSLNINPMAYADILFRKDKRTRLFLELEPKKRVELLASLTTPVKKDILLHIPDEAAVDLLQAVDPDDATDLLQLVGPHKRGRILALVSKELKDSLSTLLEFDPETAAGLMTLDYIQVAHSDNISTVAKKFKQHEKQTGRPPVILVRKEDKLAGFLPGHELGFTRPSEKIGKYVKRLPSISYAATHDEVLQKFRSHPHSKVAVLNDDGNVLGIIYSDDALKVIQEHQASSLYDFAGIRQEESVTDSARRKVQNRYRWLIINLATGFLAAATVGLFEDTLQAYVLLAIYMPIVAGMGGNAATQTLAVQVRGIALKQIELKTAWRTLKNELGAGLINGLLTGFLVAVIVILTTQNYKIAAVLAIAMVLNLLVAATFGTLMPLVMDKLGKDPAASATIFITTATDVLGFMAFLGLATLVL